MFRFQAFATEGGLDVETCIFRSLQDEPYIILAPLYTRNVKHTPAFSSESSFIRSLHSFRRATHGC